MVAKLSTTIEKIKNSEEKRIQTLEQKYENDMRIFRDDMNKQLSEMMLMIQQNPKLSYVKPEILEKKRKITYFYK